MNDCIFSSKSEVSEEERGSGEARGASSFRKLIFSFLRFGFVASRSPFTSKLLRLLGRWRRHYSNFIMGAVKPQPSRNFFF